MKTIKGSGFELRHWRKGDEPSLQRYADNRKIWQNLTDAFPSPYTISDARKWIKRTSEPQKKRATFAIEINGEAAGGIGLDLNEETNRRTATFGYWLGEEHWGKGIMSEAVRLFVKYAFKEFRLERLDAKVFIWNKGSKRVLEKNGFRYEGTLRKHMLKAGKLIDEHVYAKIKP